MRKYRHKFGLLGFLTGILAVVLLAGAVMGVARLTAKDVKTISAMAFDVGAIDAEGNYQESELSICTMKMFECKGLLIEPDSDAKGTYQVFYYDAEKSYIGSTPVMNAADGAYSIERAFADAGYARVMITPAVPVDEEGNVEEDFRITSLGAKKYAAAYTITVDKKQYENMMAMVENGENSAVLLGEGNWNTEKCSFVPQDTNLYFYERTDVKNADTVYLRLHKNTLCNIERVGAYNVFFPAILGFTSSDDYTPAYEYDYELLELEGDYVLVSFNVESYESIMVRSDVNSVDCLILYVER
jgi:hypothetical protein